MKLKTLNGWLSLIANLGVVAGLGVLIFEMNQATRLAETEAYVARVDQIQEAYLEYALSDQIPVISVKARAEGVNSLSSVERSRLRALEMARMLRMQGQYYQYRQGYIDYDTVQDVLDGAAFRLEFWRQLNINIVDIPFREAVEQQVRQSNNP